MMGQTGPLFVAGKSKKCDSPDCSHSGHHYHASKVLRISLPPSDSTPEPSLTSEQVKQEMDVLRQSFQPDLKRRPAQAALHAAWHRTWEEYGPDLLHCCDIPGLPPDNLMLESLFGRLRRHQRRVSGLLRKPLYDAV